MNEARRFLRYVVPGVVFLALGLVYLWIYDSSLAKRAYRELVGGNEVPGRNCLPLARA